MLGVLVALVCLTRSAIYNFREYGRVQRSLADYQAQQSRLRDREQAALHRLQQPQFQETLRKAKYVNTLIHRRRLSLTGLAAKLTRLLPADVRVTALSLLEGGEDPVVRMTIESSGQQKIIAFVQNVEGSPDFSDAVISSEEPGQQGNGGTPGGAARMICTANYRGWQSPGEISEPSDRTDDETGPAPTIPEIKGPVSAPKAPFASRGPADPAAPQARQSVSGM
jgi:hypothetical protein